MGRDRTTRETRICRSVSIHAPAWGATDSRLISRRLNLRFNSRARMGRDHQCRGHGSGDIVSIHAPAWGAAASMAFMLKSKVFQFTRPHGARPRRPWRNDIAFGFNSRARMGRDAAWVAVPRFPAVSIHAPAWGATSRPRPPGPDKKFQFTRPHGARRRGLAQGR